MKKLLLAMLAVGSITAANAQKNSILVYGNAGLSTNTFKVEDTKSTMTNWNISPGVGYQFSNHSTIGLQGGYTSSKIPNDAGLDSGQHEYTIGAFYRYTHYFNKTFSLFAQVNAGYVGGKYYTNDYIGTEETLFEQEYSGFSINAFPALAINIHNGLALNFGFGGIGYKTTKLDIDDFDVSNNEFNITFGQQLNIGISKNFACHSKGHHAPGDDLHRSENAYDEDEDAPKKSKKRSNDDE